MSLSTYFNIAESCNKFLFVILVHSTQKGKKMSFARVGNFALTFANISIPSYLILHNGVFSERRLLVSSDADRKIVGISTYNHVFAPNVCKIHWKRKDVQDAPTHIQTIWSVEPFTVLHKRDDGTSLFNTPTISIVGKSEDFDVLDTETLFTKIDDPRSDKDTYSFKGPFLK
jgi:hypothetical protein